MPSASAGTATAPALGRIDRVQTPAGRLAFVPIEAAGAPSQQLGVGGTRRLGSRLTKTDCSSQRDVDDVTKRAPEAAIRAVNADADNGIAFAAAAWCFTILGGRDARGSRVIDRAVRLNPSFDSQGSGARGGSGGPGERDGGPPHVAPAPRAKRAGDEREQPEAPRTGRRLLSRSPAPSAISCSRAASDGEISPRATASGSDVGLQSPAARRSGSCRRGCCGSVRRSSRAPRRLVEGVCRRTRGSALAAHAVMASA